MNLPEGNHQQNRSLNRTAHHHHRPGGFLALSATTLLCPLPKPTTEGPKLRRVVMSGSNSGVKWLNISS